MKRSKNDVFRSMSAFVVVFLFFISCSLWAKTSITSSFGFSVVMPDDEWFVLGPEEVAKANEEESIESLGIHKIPDQDLFDGIFAKIKSGNIEFYYDGKYIKSNYKNHVSAQLGSPLLFDSVGEMKASWDEQCESLPKELENTFGEDVTLHSCELLPMNRRAVFHHAYTLPSQGITVIHEQIPVNSKYSIIFVGGSGNDSAGLHRVRAAQQALVESATEFLNEQES